MKIQSNHFLLLTLISLFFQSSTGLTQTNEIKESLTESQLIQSFEDKHREFKTFFYNSDPTYGKYDLNYFSIFYTLQKASSQLISLQIFNIDPEVTLDLLTQIYNKRNKSKNSSETNPIRVVNEFNSLKEDLQNRGYEYQNDNDYFLFTKSLSMSYKQPLIISNIHELNFEYKILFQKKSQTLKFGDEFPSLKLRGSIVYNCDDKIQNCKIANLRFNETAIAWSILEARGRGASSSAGGN